MSAWAYFKNTPPNPKFIAHHGIKGQKWGIRRFQNEDGSLTAEGMARYGVKGIKKGHLSQDNKGKYRLTEKGAKFYNKFNKDDKLNSGEEVDLNKYAQSLSKKNKRNAATAATAIAAISAISISGVAIYKYSQKGKDISEDSIDEIEDEKISNFSGSNSSDPEMDRIIKGHKMWDALGKEARKDIDNAERKMKEDSVKYKPFNSEIISKSTADQRRKAAEESAERTKRIKETEYRYRNDIADIVKSKSKEAAEKTGYSYDDSKKVDNLRTLARAEAEKEMRVGDYSPTKQELNLKTIQIFNEYMDKDPDAKEAMKREREYNRLTDGLYDNVVNEVARKKYNK